MPYHATSPEDYISQVPKERQDTLKKLRQTLQKNLPAGFKEGMQHKIPGFYVPLSTYPKGYHCTPNEPLPFISYASQKNSVNLYHYGIYAKKELYDWFVNEYPKYCTRKLDMGKSCIRFKMMAEIPFDLIGKLAQKMTVDEWISIYEKATKKQ